MAADMHVADPVGAAEWFFERAAAELSADAAFALATLKRVREANRDCEDTASAAKSGKQYTAKVCAQSLAKFVARDAPIVPGKPGQFSGKAAPIGEQWEALRNAGSAGSVSCSDADFELSKEMFAEYRRDVAFVHSIAFDRDERKEVSAEEWCAARLKALSCTRTNPTEGVTTGTSYWLYSKVIERAAVLAEQVAADDSAVTCSLGGARKANARDSARQGRALFLAGQLRQEQGDTKTALKHFKNASLANVPGAALAAGKCLLEMAKVAKRCSPFDSIIDELAHTTAATTAAEAAEVFQKEADAGNPDAMVLLGNCRLADNGMARNDPECAVALFTRAVELNCRAGMNALGNCYRDGVGIAADPVKARALFVAASAPATGTASSSTASTGSTVSATDEEVAKLDGICNLALCFLDGIGGPCNPGYGVQLLVDVAKKGCMRAYTHLGMISSGEHGCGLARSPPASLPPAQWLFQKAADTNDPRGVFKYGMLLVSRHLQARLCTTTTTTATTTMSAKPPLCCSACGFDFYRTSRTCKQLQCGTILLTQAALSGITEAHAHVANALRAMDGGRLRNIRDPTASFLKLYLRGDALGDTLSQYSLAEYHHSISENERALHFASRASDAGFSAGTVLLGTICGTQGRHATAVSHYKAAANAGNLEGIHALAWCFKLGRGVEQDTSKAALLFRSASSKGHLPSRFEAWVCCQQGHHHGGGCGGGSTSSADRNSCGEMRRNNGGAAFDVCGSIADPTFVAFLNACKQGTMDSSSDSLAQFSISEDRMMLIAQYYTDASSAANNVGKMLVAMHTAVEPSTGRTGSALAASNGHLASLHAVLAHRLTHVLPALAKDRTIKIANTITDFNFGITLQDGHGKMMLQRAAEHGHWNVVKWLLKEGALDGFDGAWSSPSSSSSSPTALGSNRGGGPAAVVGGSLGGSQESILDAFDEFATLVVQEGPMDVATDVLVERAALLAAAAADVCVALERTTASSHDHDHGAAEDGDGGSSSAAAVFAGFVLMNAAGRLMRVVDGTPYFVDVHRTFWTTTVESKQLLVRLLQRLEVDGLYRNHPDRSWRCKCYACPGCDQNLRGNRDDLTPTMLTFLAGTAQTLAYFLNHTTPTEDVVPAGLIRQMVTTMSHFINSNVVHVHANAKPKWRGHRTKSRRYIQRHVKPFVCYPGGGGGSGLMPSSNGFGMEDARLFNQDLLPTLSVRDAADAAMDVFQASTAWASAQHSGAADTCLLNAANEIASSLYTTIAESKSASTPFEQPFPVLVILPAEVEAKDTQLKREAAMVHNQQMALAVTIICKGCNT